MSANNNQYYSGNTPSSPVSPSGRGASNNYDYYNQQYQRGGNIYHQQPQQYQQVYYVDQYYAAHPAYGQYYQQYYMQPNASSPTTTTTTTTALQQQYFNHPHAQYYVDANQYYQHHPVGYGPEMYANVPVSTTYSNVNSNPLRRGNKSYNNAVNTTTNNNTAATTVTTPTNGDINAISDSLAKTSLSPAAMNPIPVNVIEASLNQSANLSAMSSATQTPERQQKEAEDLAAKILKQVEYYFSDNNLPTDKFLMKQMCKDPERLGWVDVSVIASFKKMRALTRDVNAIVEALRKSTLLVLSEDGKRIRRASISPDFVLAMQQYREDNVAQTVFAEFLPPNSTQESLLALFGKYGNVVSVQLVPSKSNPQKSDLAFIEFSTEDEAKRAVAEMNDKNNWRRGLRVKPKKEWLRFNEKEQSRKQKQQQEQQQQPSQQEATTTPARGPSPAPAQQQQQQPQPQRVETVRETITSKHHIITIPRGPDGTRGFHPSAGRGRPVSAAASAH